jgi:hypothetical protein
MPILKSLGNCEHFTIPDLIVAFGFLKGHRSEGDRMPEGVYIIAFLQDYLTSSVSWGIDFNSGRTIWAPNGQNRFGDKGSLECLKSGLLSSTPYKGHIFLGKVVKWPAYLEEVLDKVLVEIGKPNETPEFFEFHWRGPILDSFYFDWIHGNFTGADDQPEIVDMELLKFALFELEVEIVFFEMAKNFVNNLPIFIEDSALDENVIEIDCDLSFGN